MKARKMVAAVACAALLVVGSVAATLAYFTDAESATNTFTVGQVGITLDEAKVNPDGTLVSPADRTKVGNEYHLIPGHTYVKDPTVTVEAGSEDSYVRMMVKVENIDALKAAMPASDADFASYYNGEVFLLQNLCMDDCGPNANCTWNSDVWKFETFHAAGEYANCYEFRCETAVNEKSGPAQDGVLDPLFTHITVPGEIDNEHLAFLANVKITVTAHAIQAEGFDNADKAWAAFDAQQS